MICKRNIAMRHKTNKPCYTVMVRKISYHAHAKLKPRISGVIRFHCFTNQSTLLDSFYALSPMETQSRIFISVTGITKTRVSE